MDEVKAKHAQEIGQYSDKKDDPFYAFTEINPSITDRRDSIQVSLPVPEYAAKDLMLTFNDKELILTTTRRYKDVFSHELGQKKIDRVESLTNRIYTGHHLDPKSVKSTYENGVMTYVINKA